MQRSVFIRRNWKLLILICVMLLVMMFAGCGSNSGVQQSTTQAESIVTENTDSLTEENNTIVEDTAETTSASSVTTEQSESDPSIQNATQTVEEESKVTKTMKMLIGDTEVVVDWEENESVDTLKELAASGDLIISMSMYGGFEQVGSIGASLPRNDVQITTAAGDIVLYSGNQMVVFYGSNSWAYTRLGKVTDKTADEMAELLGNGDVTITISLD